MPDPNLFRLKPVSEADRQRIEATPAVIVEETDCLLLDDDFDLDSRWPGRIYRSLELIKKFVT